MKDILLASLGAPPTLDLGSIPKSKDRQYMRMRSIKDRALEWEVLDFVHFDLEKMDCRTFCFLAVLPATLIYFAQGKVMQKKIKVIYV